MSGAAKFFILQGSNDDEVPSTAASAHIDRDAKLHQSNDDQVQPIKYHFNFIYIHHTTHMLHSLLLYVLLSAALILLVKTFPKLTFQSVNCFPKQSM